MDYNIKFTLSNQTIDVKDLLSVINDGIKSEKVKDVNFVSRILAINRSSLGIKYSSEPFNVHKSITEKFIKEMFGLDINVNHLVAKGLEQLQPKILHIFVKCAKNLNQNNINPYFKLFLRSNCKNDGHLQSSKPFISRHLKNNSNPKWNSKLDLIIPNSSGSDALDSKVYKQEICLEIWSKNIKISTFKELINCIFRVKIDKYLGSVHVKVGERSADEQFFTYLIPSTALNLVLPLSEDNKSVIEMKIVWGRLQNNSQNNNSFIKYHIMLYTICLEWHIKHFQSNGNQQLMNELINNQELSYFNFLMMSAISLINQHKIQSNITSYEDLVLRRYVLSHLMIKLSKVKNDFSFILAKVLANEEITINSNTAWLSDHYIKSLNELEEVVIKHIIQNYLEKMTLLADPELNAQSITIKELLYILKLMRKYHRKYRALKLKETINRKIGTEIIKWLKSNVTEPQYWPKIRNFMAILSKILREYWKDSIGEIIGQEGLNLVIIELKLKLKILINDWKKNKNRQKSDLILDYFLFIEELNEIFSVEKVIENLTETESDLVIKKRKSETIYKKVKPHEEYLEFIPLTQSQS